MVPGLARIAAKTQSASRNASLGREEQRQAAIAVTEMKVAVEAAKLAGTNPRVIG